MSSRESYLVIGGCGFLGRNIVEALLARGEPEVAVFDLVQRHFDTNVQFFTGDIADERAVSNAIQKSGATAIFHTASPIHGLPSQIYEKVNVEGTKTVIAASLANGVKKLVYTSSAGLVFDGVDLIDVDERLPPPEKPMDAYNGTKAVAEKLILDANGQAGLKTVALRPSGIYGPGDRQMLIQIARTVRRGQTKVQLGSNNNLTDWTYVGNVVKAHLLAVDRLSTLQSKTDILSAPLPSIATSTAERRVPTSLARPLGPAVTPPPDAAEIESAFCAPRETEDRAFVRSKFDPFGALALEREEKDPLQVAGQVFNITNCEPMYFWDVTRTLMMGLGAPKENVNRPQWVLPQSISYVFAWAAEWAAWLAGKEPNFTQLRVTYACATRYYNCEKARRVLGYEPDVGMKEGLEKTIEWWNTTQKEAFDAQELKQ